MSAVQVLLVAVIGLAILYRVGGLALRLSGALAFWAGTAGLLASGAFMGLLVAALGLAAWIAGQAHHARRHGGASGPLGNLVLGLLRRTDRT